MHLNIIRFLFTQLVDKVITGMWNLSARDNKQDVSTVSSLFQNKSIDEVGDLHWQSNMDFSEEKFTFTWNIEDLICIKSSVNQKVSTSFKVLMLDETEWELQLLFSDPISKINVLLFRLDDGGPETIQVGFEIYFFATDGSSNFKVYKKGVNFAKGKCFQSKPRPLHKNNFIKETVALKCVLWKSYGNDDDGSNKVSSLSLPCVLTDKAIDKIYKDSCKQMEGKIELSNVYPNKCSAVTRFKMEKRSLIYNLEQFSLLQNIASIPFTTATDIASLFLTLQLKKDSDEVEVCVRVVEDEIGDFLFVKCKIWALSRTQNSICILEDTNVFKPKNDTVWKTSSFRKSSLSAEGSLYIQGDILSLQIELTVHNGETTTEIREIGFAEPPKINNYSKTLSEELYQFFVNQTFCDITLETKNDAIKAHKIVVCAKSPVFRAMFENEMSEKISQVVKIPDVDIHSLRRLLTFMYSEKFENILNEYDAMKLYSVADKYQYDKLKKKCSDFLKSNILIANVCDVLELADRHQDSGLKLAAQVYIKSKCHEILTSDEWKNLIENNVHLASDTLVYISTSIQNF